MKTTVQLFFVVALLITVSCSREKVNPITQTQAYGLGNNLTKSVSNNVNYNWYFDQGTSGPYSPVNCGPTSVTMAIKWANENFSLTPQNAREKYRSSGGWWYTSDIINYLNDNTINNYTVGLTDMNVLKAKIDDGHVVILCLDMYFVNEETNKSYHVDKFYEASDIGWGHFIVIKGYKQVDGNTYFEAYDPYSLGVEYVNNVLKGKDRYYRSSNLDAATNNWWDYAIVINKPGATGGRLSADPNAVDPALIRHMSGR